MNTQRRLPGLASLLCFVATLVAGPTLVRAAAAPESRKASALVRIEAAFQEGEIDAPTRALYGLYLLRDSKRLPESLQPAPGEQSVRCGAMLYTRAMRERDAMNSVQLAEYDAITGGRPFVPAGTEFAVNHPIRVHYADVADAAIAADVAGYADESWEIEVEQFGWRAPLLDPDIEGATDLDIYLDPNATFAYCAPEYDEPGTPNDDYSTYIVINPGFPGLETFVAHEFNHSIQFAYTASEGDLIYEATATWMEDEVYDASNDYVDYTGDFVASPDRTLSYATYSDNYMYGAAIWLHYLAERFDGGGTAKIREIWDLAEETGTNYFQAIEQGVLTGSGPSTIEEMYAEFAGYRFLSGANADGWSSEAASWDAAPVGASHALTDGITGGTISPDPMKLGAGYVQVATAGAVNGDRLTFTLNGGTGTGWAVTAVRIPASGRATVEVFRDDDDDGVVVARSDSNQQFDKVVFAAVNLGAAGQSPDVLSGNSHSVDVTRSSFTYDLFYSAEGGDPAEEPVACECRTTRSRPTAGAVFAGFFAAAAILVLRRRAGG